MNASTPLETVETYLKVQLTHLAYPGASSHAGPFVTLSREAGTGGSALAQTLALRLPPGPEARPWTVYSGNLIAEMLRTNHLPPELAKFLPEDRIPEVDASVGQLVGLHPDLWTLVAKTNELIRHLARLGNVILVGRGANFATHGLAHGVHVRLVASAQYRSRQTLQRVGISEEAARAQNLHRDTARRRYVSATFNANIDDPTAYDLVLNAERLTLETMVELVARLVALAVPPAPAADERARLGTNFAGGA